MLPRLLSTTTRNAARLAVLSLIFVGAPVLGSALAEPGDPRTESLSGRTVQSSGAAEASVRTLRVPEVATVPDEVPPEMQAPARHQAPAEEGPARPRGSAEGVAPEVADEPAVVASLSATRTEKLRPLGGDVGGRQRSRGPAGPGPEPYRW